MPLSLKTSNLYSDKKIVWQHDKLESLRTGIVSPPIYVRIKPINHCCHACPWCAYNSGENNESFEATGMHTEIDHKSRIPWPKLQEVLNDLHEMGVKCVTFSGGGEPLMYPRIAEAFFMTREAGIGLSVITNGQLLDGERSAELHSADWVRVSMDYCDAEMFAKSRGFPESKYKKILSNIRDFAALKAPSCDLSVNYIITRENHHRVYEAAQLLKSLGVDNVRFSPVWTAGFVAYHEPLKQSVLDQLTWALDLQSDTFKVYHSYRIKEGLDKRSYHQCFIQQIIPVIGADSLVYNCHNKAYSQDAIIGSIRDQSFKTMWFSEETRRHFQEFDAMKICDGCQCANDSKNVFMHELIESYGDNYV